MIAFKIAVNSGRDADRCRQLLQDSILEVALIKLFMVLLDLRHNSSSRTMYLQHITSQWTMLSFMS